MIDKSSVIHIECEYWILNTAQHQVVLDDLAVYKGLSGRKIIKMKMHLGKTISLPGTGDAHTSMTLVLEYQFGVYKIRMIFEIEDEYIRPISKQ